MVPYTLIIKYLNRKWEDKRLQMEWQQACPDSNMLLIS